MQFHLGERRVAGSLCNRQRRQPGIRGIVRSCRSYYVALVVGLQSGVAFSVEDDESGEEMDGPLDACEL
jgi:hypothetical protein